jgi:beta-lactamase class D
MAISTEAEAKENVKQNINFERHFRELGVEGAILIYDAKNDRFYQHNPQRNCILASINV